MYLEFINDIAKVGNYVLVRTNSETIEGVIVKLSNDLIAIQTKDGSIVVKKDNEITNIQILPTDKTDTAEKITQLKPTVRCGMTLIKNDKVETFTCSICGKSKSSKKISKQCRSFNPNRKLRKTPTDLADNFECI